MSILISESDDYTVELNTDNAKGMLLNKETGNYTYFKVTSVDVLSHSNEYYYDYTIWQLRNKPESYGHLVYDMDELNDLPDDLELVEGLMTDGIHHVNLTHAQISVFIGIELALYGDIIDPESDDSDTDSATSGSATDSSDDF